MDDTLPLLSGPDCQIGGRYEEQNSKDIVDFDPKGDAENPMEWPVAYKWSIVALLALTAFTVTFTCCAVVPIANRIVDDLDGAQSSKSASVLLVTIWELGEAAGPLLIGPLSEVFGRYPVINVSNILFIAATVLAAVCQSSSLLIGARALTGLAVATGVLSPAIVGDIFLPERRGTAMSFVQMAPLLGGAIGPAISGAIAERLGWRCVMWISVALASFCEVVFLSFFRETYKVPILRRKAARLRRETGNESLKTVFDIEGRGLLQNVGESVMRPMVVFLNSGVLQAMSLFGALVFTFFYIMSVSLPYARDIMGDIYHLTPALIGSAFMSFSESFCNLPLE
ncbi:hypothetical protein DL768_004067 [Monosporascus sp. mg162]|nr:hypothetical protein DL768_004067 [Monosporascus sp. mg162]